MNLAELYLLKAMLKAIAGMVEEGGYYLSDEERLALQHFNQVADIGEDSRFCLFQMALDVGIAPGHLLYLRGLAWLGVTVID